VVEHAEIRQALDALSGLELRAAVRATLDDLDEDVRAAVIDPAARASDQGLVRLRSCGRSSVPSSTTSTTINELQSRSRS